MAELRNEIEIAAPPERVWEVVGDLAAAPDWVPGIASAEVVGSRRICTTADGSVIQEEISDYSDAGRTYRYEQVQTPLPVAMSAGRLTVEAGGAGSRVVWDAELEPLDAGQAAGLLQMVDAAYKETLESLRRRCE